MIQWVVDTMKQMPSRCEMYIAIAIISLATSIIAVNFTVERHIHSAMDPCLDRLDRCIRDLDNHNRE